MTITIAVAGKGGTGKTTLSGLLVRYLVQHGGGKILAIDADPSSNLHLVLGLPLTQTIGDIREDSRDRGDTRRAPRQDWLGYAVRMAVEEGDDCRPAGDGPARGAGVLLCGQPHAAQHHGRHQRGL